MRTPEPLIDVSDLGKRYGARDIVSGLSMRLSRGEIIGLVGANGGGKTTTLRMLAGLIQPDDGEGNVLGHDIRRRRGDGIGYMSQRLSLYPELTVAENLRFRGQVYGASRDRIGEVVDRFGLAPVLGTRFDHLSGGWARRVQFAATIVPAPALLLLDEPTAGLDVTTRNDLWRWLGELAVQGVGVVISTHDLAEAERCPSILHFVDGRVEGPIAPATLIARSGAPSLEVAVAMLAQ